MITSAPAPPVLAASEELEAGPSLSKDFTYGIILGFGSNSKGQLNFLKSNNNMLLSDTFMKRVKCASYNTFFINNKGKKLKYIFLHNRCAFGMW